MLIHANFMSNFGKKNFKKFNILPGINSCCQSLHYDFLFNLRIKMVYSLKICMQIHASSKLLLTYKFVSLVDGEVDEHTYVDNKFVVNQLNDYIFVHILSYKFYITICINKLTAMSTNNGTHLRRGPET